MQTGAPRRLILGGEDPIDAALDGVLGRLDGRGRLRVGAATAGAWQALTTVADHPGRSGATTEITTGQAPSLDELASGMAAMTPFAATIDRLYEDPETAAARREDEAAWEDYLDWEHRRAHASTVTGPHREPWGHNDGPTTLTCPLCGGAGPVNCGMCGDIGELRGPVTWQVRDAVTGGAAEAELADGHLWLLRQEVITPFTRPDGRLDRHRTHTSAEWWLDLRSTFEALAVEAGIVDHRRYTISAGDHITDPFVEVGPLPVQLPVGRELAAVARDAITTHIGDQRRPGGEPDADGVVTCRRLTVRPARTGAELLDDVVGVLTARWETLSLTHGTHAGVVGPLVAAENERGGHSVLGVATSWPTALDRAWQTLTGTE